ATPPRVRRAAHRRAGSPRPRLAVSAREARASQRRGGAPLARQRRPGAARGLGRAGREGGVAAVVVARGRERAHPVPRLRASLAGRERRGGDRVERCGAARLAFPARAMAREQRRVAEPLAALLRAQLVVEPLDGGHEALAEIEVRSEEYTSELQSR